MKRVVVFGTFDLIHPGHIAFLTAARKLGDELVVVVTRDARVRAEKGRAPLFNQKERLAIVQAIRSVDRAVLGEPPGKWSLLAKLRPSVVAVGHDQPVSKSRTTHQIVRIKRFGPLHHTSSRIKKRLLI